MITSTEQVGKLGKELPKVLLLVWGEVIRGRGKGPRGRGGSRGRVLDEGDCLESPQRLSSMELEGVRPVVMYHHPYVVPMGEGRNAGSMDG